MRNIDYFIKQDNNLFAGTHLIIDFWDGIGYDDLEFIRSTLRRAVVASEATLLDIHLHYFSENNGISGVAILKESHISIHSCPEAGYAAFDIFMCGDCEPYKAVEVLQEAFEPESSKISNHYRGIINQEGQEHE